MQSQSSLVTILVESSAIAAEVIRALAAAFALTELSVIVEFLSEVLAAGAARENLFGTMFEGTPLPRFQ
jgi:hypothetical protein